jgi:transposase
MKRFFDERRRKSVIAMLSLGMTRRDAAHCIGCNIATLYNEAARNRSFRVALIEAESGFEVRHRKRIDDASKESKNWRASAWALLQKQKRLALHTATQEQIDQILAEFAAILIAEIPDVRTRKQILGKLCRAMGAKQKSKTTRKEPNDASQNPT